MADNWKHRSLYMRCFTCMYYVAKQATETRQSAIGRCRRNAPTMKGWPVMFENDWCGEHKLDENKSELSKCSVTQGEKKVRNAKVS